MTPVKVTCILASYNRPRWIRHALKSVADQDHPDIQLVVVDESTSFDVRSTVSDFRFKEVDIHHFDVSRDERGRQNRLGLNMNFGLSRASGDLVSFLCDDDYYYPGWLSAAARFFRENPAIQAGFGILRYSRDPGMVYPEAGKTRFFDGPVANPFCVLDHNQVIHRRFQPAYAWPTDPAVMGDSDAHYFRSISKNHVFHPIRVMAAVKRLHAKNLQRDHAAIRNGTASEVRE